jgi:cation transporter-like permease
MCRNRASTALHEGGLTASDHQQGREALMLTALILVVFAAVVLILTMLAVVVVAIRQEPRDREISNLAPSLIAVIVRRLLGVYVRRPGLPEVSTGWKEESSPDMPLATARSRPLGGRR